MLLKAQGALVSGPQKFVVPSLRFQKLDGPTVTQVGAEIVNVGGTEAVTTQEYCRMAGEILGKEPEFVENGRAWPIWADTTKMVQLLGSNTVSIREGVRRTIEAAHDRLTTSHHVIGEPTKV